MARAQQLQYRAGPNAISATGAAIVIAQFALTDLTLGLAVNDVTYYEIVVTATSSATYSNMAVVTVPVSLLAGPTYGIGAANYALMHSVGGGMWDSPLTVDQSGGNLRIIADRSGASQSFTCIAVATSLSV